jgi:membrane protease YdiL (CAAX protease family)
MHRNGEDERVVDRSAADPVSDASCGAHRLPSFRWAIWLFLISTVLVVVLGSVVQAFHTALGLVFTELALILAPAVVAAMLQKLDITATFSLRRPAAIDMALALVAGGCGWALAVQGTNWLVDLAGADQRTLAALRPIDPAMVAVMAIFPICEEVLFRGYVFAGLRTRYRPLPAMAVTAFLFGVYHQDPVRIPAACLLGLGFGVALLRTGSIFPAMGMHLAANTCAGLLTRTDLGTEVASWWQLLAAAAGLAACLMLMGRSGRRVRFPALPKPARPTVFLAIAVVMVAGGVLGIPRYLDLLRWQHVLGRNGTIQFDHYRMRDDYSFRKESTVVLWGEGVALWADGGSTLSIPRGDGFISAEIGGDELPFELLPESTVALTLPRPAAAATVLEVVCEGSLDPMGPHRFPSHPFVPVVAIRATVDLRDAPALRFDDSSYRVKTPMFLFYPRFVDASDGVGWVEVPLVGR